MPATLCRAAIPWLLLLAGPCGVPLAAQMDGAEMAHGHMSFTPLRAGTAADTARALDMVHRLRAAIAPYQTISDARAAGYRAWRDTTTVRRGALLHLGRRMRWRDRRSFDPGAPQSLLYRRTADGSMRLAGAMFVAPRSATDEDLDAMVPLSVARWHRHVGVCLVRSPVQGPRVVLRHVGSAEACDEAGGWYRARTRYMVHVMIDGGEDLDAVFPQGR